MSTKRVLVIDDEPELSFVIQTVLRKIGNWTALVANSGLEGLLQAKSEQPDVILLDVMMPDLDGPTILQNLKEMPETRSIPVILLTAKVQPDDYDRYAQLKISGVIAKPFAPLDLVNQIAKILDWSL